MMLTSLTRWQRAALDGIHRFARRHQTRLIQRLGVITEELPTIVAEAGSKGATPAQTLSRVLQELRRAGIIHHVSRGVDLLLDEPLDVESEDLPEAALDAAIEHDQLRIRDVSTGDAQVTARRRKGQDRIRQHILTNYGRQCALCDVSDSELLEASHIVPWSADPDAQGRLSNVVCLCQMHHALFETGYIALTDNLRVLRKESRSAVVRYLQSTAERLRSPKSHPPATVYLRQHRQRTGFERKDPGGTAT
jgi:hypothetical protein